VRPNLSGGHVGLGIGPATSTTGSRSTRTIQLGGEQVGRPPTDRPVGAAGPGPTVSASARSLSTRTSENASTSSMRTPGRCGMISRQTRPRAQRRRPARPGPGSPGRPRWSGRRTSPAARRRGSGGRRRTRRLRGGAGRRGARPSGRRPVWPATRSCWCCAGRPARRRRHGSRRSRARTVGRLLEHQDVAGGVAPELVAPQLVGAHGLVEADVEDVIGPAAPGQAVAGVGHHSGAVSDDVRRERPETQLVASRRPRCRSRRPASGGRG
jgi:hypothetical protein